MKLGDRMKQYENSFKVRFTDRLPVIVRLDGKAFHTITKKCEKPFDMKVIEIFNLLSSYLVENIQGAVFAYTQSDEISILLYPWKKQESQAWFDNEMNKINSISAAMASAIGTQLWCDNFSISSLFPILFDSRSFVLPESEVVNYFIWRQKDWIRNSVQMLGRAHFSQKELHGKSNEQIRMMLERLGETWEDLPLYNQRGRVIYWKTDGESKEMVLDTEIPLFTENREYIENTFLFDYA